MTNLNHRAAGALAVLLALVATSADARVLPFSGTQRNQDLPAQPPFRCAPQITVNIRPDPFYAEGTSNLGDFSVQQSHCITPPLPAPFTDGVFDWSFDRGGSITGTYSGVLTNSGTPGVFAIDSAYTITGGTGRFRHATGGFDTEGTLQFVMGRPTAEQTFNGTIVTPQPAAAGLFALGLAGLALGRRRRAAR